ncbi:MAG: hypothetical protein AAB670_01090, partial [Patescibacteria group bacterium]
MKRVFIVLSVFVFAFALIGVVSAQDTTVSAPTTDMTTVSNAAVPTPSTFQGQAAPDQASGNALQPSS